MAEVVSISRRVGAGRVIAGVLWTLGTIGCGVVVGVLNIAREVWSAWNLARVPQGDGQAGIGEFAAVVVAGAVIAVPWGVADGWRQSSLPSVIVRWALATVLGTAAHFTYLMARNEAEEWVVSSTGMAVVTGSVYMVAAVSGWALALLLPQNAGATPPLGGRTLAAHLQSSPAQHG